VFDKKHTWGEFDEIPLRFADSLSGDDPSFELHDPHLEYEPSFLKDAIEKMVDAEGSHFTTPIFLAMHGHDISVAYPHESAIIKKAQEAVGEKYQIAHTNLEEYWKEVIQHLDKSQMTVLEGERRSYLKTGMWTYLFPATISARTYLKQQDFDASTRLTCYAEPLASLAHTLGDKYPTLYLDRGWKYLLSNHTHDANGGCAPDPVCLDMEYRYRKTSDISNIVSENAMSYIASHIAPGKMDQQSMQFVVFNPLPFKRDVIVKADLEIPGSLQAKSVSFGHESQPTVERQPVYSEKSSVFMDSKWDVPTILDSERMVLYAQFKDLPPLGYRSYTVTPEKQGLRVASTLMTGDDSMENEFISVKINPNGTVNITNKETGRTFNNLNYITDQGEAGNAWQHEDIRFDKKINSLGVASRNSVSESGPLVSTLSAEFSLSLPVDYGDGTRRNEMNTEVPVKIDYTLEKGSRYLKVKTTLVNNAKDHWLRVNFPSGIQTDVVGGRQPLRCGGTQHRTSRLYRLGGRSKRHTPLRTFVDVSDGKEGLACFTKGIFEYEVFDTPDRNLAITLIRACRIKLKVSEEKISELPDVGVQCPGLQTFEYAICPHTGNHADAGLANLAAEYYTPARAVMAGRGKGDLPQEAFLFGIDNPKVHVTAVKLAEDQSGTSFACIIPPPVSRQ
jgi:mannosylglycerate hydrolase